MFLLPNLNIPGAPVIGKAAAEFSPAADIVDIAADVYANIVVSAIGPDCDVDLLDSLIRVGAGITEPCLLCCSSSTGSSGTADIE